MKLDLKKLTILATSFRKLKNLPIFLAENAFFASLLLILLAAVLGLLVSYEYIFLTERREFEFLPESPFLNEEDLQDILSAKQERQARFDQAQSKEYNDPF